MRQSAVKYYSRRIYRRRTGIASRILNTSRNGKTRLRMFGVGRCESGCHGAATVCGSGKCDPFGQLTPCN